MAPSAGATSDRGGWDGIARVEKVQDDLAGCSIVSIDGESEFLPRIDLDEERTVEGASLLVIVTPR
jgi:hypothetical protein